ncbi:hypothetical protein QOT17_018383 [Balamuthia mandrillaris]
MERPKNLMQEAARIQAQLGSAKEKDLKLVKGQKGVKETIPKGAVAGRGSVYFENCKDCEYIVNSISVKVLIEKCENCTIILNGPILTNMVEMWKCNNVILSVNTMVMTLQIDLCNEVNLTYSSKEHFHSVVWAGVRNMTVSFADAEKEALQTGLDEMLIEYPDTNDTTDQFIIREVNGEILSEQIVRLSNGYPTTEREAKEFDEKQAKNAVQAEAYIRKLVKFAGDSLGIKDKQKDAEGKTGRAKFPCDVAKKYKTCYVPTSNEQTAS